MIINIKFLQKEMGASKSGEQVVLYKTFGESQV